MTANCCTRKPWEPACLQAKACTKLPDFIDLSDEPQLASVTLLQINAKVVAQSLLAHHGAGRCLADELSNDPHCITAVLAHLIAEQCTSMSELVEAYLLAVRNTERDD